MRVNKVIVLGIIDVVMVMITASAIHRLYQLFVSGDRDVTKYILVILIGAGATMVLFPSKKCSKNSMRRKIVHMMGLSPPYEGHPIKIPFPDAWMTEDMGFPENPCIGQKYTKKGFTIEVEMGNDKIFKKFDLEFIFTTGGWAIISGPIKLEKEDYK